MLKAPLTDDEGAYVYQIGLIAQKTGDFVLVWMESVDLQNTELNTHILENYPLILPDDLGVTRCGITSSITEVNERRGAFFFSVNQ